MIFTTESPEETPAPRSLAKVTEFFFTLSSIITYTSKFREWWRARNTYSVIINSSDRFYFQLQEWLLHQIKAEQQKAIRAVSREDNLLWVFDDKHPQTIEIEGHKIRVSTEKPKSISTSMLRAEIMGDMDEGVDEPRLVLVAKTRAGMEAAQRKLAEVRKEASRKKANPRLYLLSGWLSGNSIPLLPRPLDSVVLAEGQMERLIETFTNFLNSEQTYIERGIPWHLGVFLGGLPGTGKTSLARALASHFGLDLYYLPLGSISGDQELTRQVSGIGERSVLLLEDIDVFKGVKDRAKNGTAEKDSFSLSGLLNVTDGVMTPHGLISILTSNHESVIDPALLRPGRIDIHETLTLLQPRQGERLFASFYGQAPTEPLGTAGMSPARLIEIMKSHMDDPCAAQKKIQELT
jgi:hypothetical protein